MEQEEVIKSKHDQQQSKGLILSITEKKHLADFFAVLIQIDRRTNITKTYASKSDK